MSEEWAGEIDEKPRKKGGVPAWIWWGCGIGCLAMILLAVAAVGGMFWVGKQAVDPEKQWANLREVIYFEERPQNLDIIGLNLLFMHQYTLTSHAEGAQVNIMVFRGSASGDFDEMFKEDPAGTPFDLGAPKDPEVGEMELQGETVRFIRYSGLGGQPLGGGMRIDLTKPGGKATMAQWQYLDRDAGPPTDEQVRDFFEPFDLWKDV